jgi:hypothetical protein
MGQQEHKRKLQNKSFSNNVTKRGKVEVAKVDCISDAFSFRLRWRFASLRDRTEMFHRRMTRPMLVLLCLDSSCSLLLALVRSFFLSRVFSSLTAHSRSSDLPLVARLSAHCTALAHRREKAKAKKKASYREKLL